MPVTSAANWKNDQFGKKKFHFSGDPHQSIVANISTRLVEFFFQVALQDTKLWSVQGFAIMMKKWWFCLIKKVKIYQLNLLSFNSGL